MLGIFSFGRTITSPGLQLNAEANTRSGVLPLDEGPVASNLSTSRGSVEDKRRGEP